MDSLFPRQPLPPRAFSGAGLFFFCAKSARKIECAALWLSDNPLNALPQFGFAKAPARGIRSAAVSECKFRRRMSFF
ncbi:MAG: hypothetical protein BHW65_00975 [Verrucomicrobia bacterium CAG:312_58_20]|nr:MAG: hypothetical protein BHW65_00975 [Verrucomicrobia bacterium CAG:312_58_20]